MSQDLTLKEKCTVCMLLFLFGAVFAGFITVITTPTAPESFANTPDGIIQYIGHYNFQLKSITTDILQLLLNRNTNIYSPFEDLLYQYVVFSTLRGPPFPEEVHYVIPMDLTNKFDKSKWTYLSDKYKPAFYLPENIIVFPATNGDADTEYFYINYDVNKKIYFDNNEIYSDWECDTLDKILYLKNNPPNNYEFDKLQTHIEAGLTEVPTRPYFCFGDFYDKINRVRALYKKIV